VLSPELVWGGKVRYGTLMLLQFFFLPFLLFSHFVFYAGVLSTVIHSASSVSRVADCLADTLADGSYFRFSPGTNISTLRL
jgi:hypothetical protein